MTNMEPIEQALEDLRTGDKQAWSQAYTTICDCGDGRAVVPLLEIIRNSDNKQQIHYAAGALGIVGRLAVPELMAALMDSNDRVRALAATALGCAGALCAVGPLLRCLADESAVVRYAVVRSLGYLGDSRAVKPLIRMLADEDSRIRWNAVDSLAQFEAVEALQPLVDSLRDPDKDVANAAATALGKLGGPLAIEELISVLSRGSTAPRRAAAESLGKLGDPRAVEPLIQILRAVNDPTPYIQPLARFRDPRAVEPLMSLLSDRRPSVRDSAARALVRLNAQEQMCGASYAIRCDAAETRVRKQDALQSYALSRRESKSGDSSQTSLWVKRMFDIVSLS